MACFQVRPGRKEIYVWNGYEYDFVERPEGFDEEDEDGHGIFSIEEQKNARAKREADAMDNPLAE